MILAAGCSRLPQDPESTLNRIAQRQTVLVGVSEADARRAEVKRLLATIGERTGAVPRLRTAGQEQMLSSLEEGKLDLVIAWFDVNSPWQERVALAPALAMAGSSGHRLEFRAAAQNGENRWMMVVERASRAVVPEASH